MGESLVGFSHSMGIFLFLVCGTFLIVSSHDFSGKSFSH